MFSKIFICTSLTHNKIAWAVSSKKHVNIFWTLWCLLWAPCSSSPCLLFCFRPELPRSRRRGCPRSEGDSVGPGASVTQALHVGLPLGETHRLLANHWASCTCEKECSWCTFAEQTGSCPWRAEAMLVMNAYSQQRGLSWSHMAPLPGF